MASRSKFTRAHLVNLIRGLEAERDFAAQQSSEAACLLVLANGNLVSTKAQLSELREERELLLSNVDSQADIVSKLEAENAKVVAECDDVKKANAQLRASQEESKGLIEGMKTQISTLEGENLSLKSDKIKIDDDYMKAVAHGETLQSEIDSISTTLSDLREEHSRCCDAVIEKQGRIDTLESSLRTLQGQFESSLEKDSGLETVIENLQNELISIKDRYEAAAKDRKKEWESKIRNLESNSAKQSKNLTEDFEKKMSEERDSRTKVEKELESVTISTKYLEERLKDTDRKWSDAVKELHTAQEQLTASVNEKESQKTLHESRFEEVQREVAQHHRTIATLEGSDANLKKLLDEKDARIDSLEKAAIEAKKEVEEDRLAQEATIQMMNDSYELLDTDSKKLLDEKDAEIDKLTKDLEEERRSTDATIQMMNDSYDLLAADSKKFSDEIDAKDAEIVRLTKDLEEERTIMNDSYNHLDADSQKQLDEKDAQLDEKDAHIDKLMKDLEEERTSTEATIYMMNESYDLLNAEHSELIGKNEDLSSKLEKLEGKLKGVQISFEESIKASEDAVQKERDLRKEIADLNAALEEAAFQALKKSEETDRNIEALNRTVDERDEALQTVHTATSELQVELQERDKIISDLSAEVASLETSVSQLEVIKQELTEAVIEAQHVSAETAELAHTSAIQSLKEEHDAALDALKDCHAASVAMHASSASALEANIEDLKDSLHKNESALEMMTHQCAKAEAEVTSLHGHQCQLEEKLEASDSRMISMQAELDNAKQATQLSDSKHAEATRMMKDTESRLFEEKQTNSALRAKETATAELIAEASSEMEKLRKDLKVLETQATDRDTMQREVTILTKQKEQLDNENETLRAELVDKTKSLKEARREHEYARNECIAVKAELHDLQDKGSESSQALRESLIENEHLKVDLRDKENELSGLLSTLETIKSQSNALADEMKVYQTNSENQSKELEDTMALLNKERQDHFDGTQSLMANVQEYTSIIKSLENKLSEKESALELEKTKRYSAAKRLRVYGSRNEHLKVTLPTFVQSAERSVLETFKVLEKEYAEANGSRDNLSSELEGFKTQVEGFTSEIAEMQEKLMVAESEIQHLRDACDEHVKEAEGLQTKVCKQQEEMTQQTEALEAKDHDIESLQAKHVDDESTIKSLTEQLAVVEQRTANVSLDYEDKVRILTDDHAAEIAERGDELSRMSTVCEELEREIKECKSQFEESAAQLEERHEASQLRIATLSEEHSAILSSKDEEMAEVKAHCDEIKSQLETLREKLASTEADVDALNADQSVKASELTELHSQCNSLRNELEILEAQHVIVKDEVSTLRKDLDDSTLKIATLNADHDSKINELNTNHADIITSKDDTIAQSECRAGELENTIQSLEDTLVKKSAAISELEKNLTNAEAQVQALNDDYVLVNSEVSEIRSQKDEFEAQIESLQQLLAESEAVAEALQKDADNSKSDLHEKEIAMTTAAGYHQTTIDNYETEIKVLRDRVADTSQRLSEELEDKDNQIADMHTKLNELKSHVSKQKEYHAEIVHLTARLKDTEATSDAQMRDLNADLLHKESAMVELSKQLETAEAVKIGLQGSLAENQAIVITRDEQLSRLQEQVEALSTELKEKEKTNDLHGGKMYAMESALQAQSAAMHTALEAERATAAEAKSSAESSKSKVIEYEGQLTELQSEVEGLQDRLKDSDLKAEVLLQDLTNKEHECDRLYEEIDGLKDELGMIESNVREEVQGEMDEVENEADRFRSEAADLKEQIDGLQADIASLEQTVEYASVDIANAEERQAETEERVRMVREDLEVERFRAELNEEAVTENRKLASQWEDQCHHLEGLLEEAEHEIRQLRHGLNSSNESSANSSASSTPPTTSRSSSRSSSRNSDTVDPIKAYSTPEAASYDKHQADAMQSMLDQSLKQLVRSERRIELLESLNQDERTSDDPLLVELVKTIAILERERYALQLKCDSLSCDGNRITDSKSRVGGMSESAVSKDTLRSNLAASLAESPLTELYDVDKVDNGFRSADTQRVLDLETENQVLKQELENTEREFNEKLMIIMTKVMEQTFEDRDFTPNGSDHGDSVELDDYNDPESETASQKSSESTSGNLFSLFRRTKQPEPKRPKPETIRKTRAERSENEMAQLLVSTKVELANVYSEHEMLKQTHRRVEKDLCDAKLEIADLKAYIEDKNEAIAVLMAANAKTLRSSYSINDASHGHRGDSDAMPPLRRRASSGTVDWEKSPPSRRRKLEKSRRSSIEDGSSNATDSPSKSAGMNTLSSPDGRTSRSRRRSSVEHLSTTQNAVTQSPSPKKLDLQVEDVDTPANLDIDGLATVVLKDPLLSDSSDSSATPTSPGSPHTPTDRSPKVTYNRRSGYSGYPDSPNASTNKPTMAMSARRPSAVPDTSMSARRPSAVAPPRLLVVPSGSGHGDNGSTITDENDDSPQSPRSPRSPSMKDQRSDSPRPMKRSEHSPMIQSVRRRPDGKQV